MIWNKKVNHPLQSWEWGEFRERRQPISRVENFLIMWTKIPGTPFVFGYIPMGKIPNETEIEKLKQEGIRHKAIGIRMEPNKVLNAQCSMLNKFPRGRSLFKKKTIIIDLTKSEEELLKNMHSKGRYNIKVAEKHQVQVRESQSENDFETYLDLMFGGTAKRQGIYAHSREYHRQLWSSLKGNIAHLFVAKYSNKLIAADIIFGFKDTIYYAYGASALEHREVMAPTLLLWRVMGWGKDQGYKFFDLWGQEEGKGFSRFKEQFGGESLELAGSYDLPIDKFLYPLFRIMEEIRWKILRILK